MVRTMLKKNDIIRIAITGISSDGNGVGRCEGQAVFVPFTAVGDVIDARVVKIMRTYAYGIIEKLITPSGDRVETDCLHFGKCGGCCFRHITYEAELRAKQSFVEDALNRIGGLSVKVSQIVPSPDVDGYRNKVQFPVSERDGQLIPGFFYQRSHRIIEIADSCLLQPGIMNSIAVYACDLMTAAGETAYDEISLKGNIRHLLLRRSSIDGSILLCVICRNGKIRGEESFVSRLTAEFPDIRTVVINQNDKAGNGILTDRHRIIMGPGYIEDSICGVPAKLTYDSFFQINHASTENLYRCVKECCDIKDGQTVIDLYCGTGTIGLSSCDRSTRLFGIEVTPKAVESAREAAVEMGFDRAEFICGDSGKVRELVSRGIIADVVITDPPRKGCSAEVLEALVGSKAPKIVMVSCNPSTLARDLKHLCENGYSVISVQPYDLFPRTKHVETVCCLYHQKKEFISVPYEPRNADYLKKNKSE